MGRVPRSPLSMPGSQALAEVAVQYHHDLESATRAVAEKDESLTRALELEKLTIKRHVQRIGRLEAENFGETLLRGRMPSRGNRQLGRTCHRRETHSMCRTPRCVGRLPRWRVN
jgi:hypothetical protein